jgi:hypothetical protein
VRDDPGRRGPVPQPPRRAPSGGPHPMRTNRWPRRHDGRSRVRRTWPETGVASGPGPAAGRRTRRTWRPRCGQRRRTSRASSANATSRLDPRRVGPGRRVEIWRCSTGLGHPRPVDSAADAGPGRRHGRATCGCAAEGPCPGDIDIRHMWRKSRRWTRRRYLTRTCRLRAALAAAASARQRDPLCARPTSTRRAESAQSIGQRGRRGRRGGRRTAAARP